MTEPTDTTDDFPAFDEAAVRAEIADYDPDKARGPVTTPRVQSSAGGMAFVLTMLPPEHRGDIPQRLAAIRDPEARATAEAALVEPVVRQLANAANIRRGHPNGNLVEQASADLINEVDALEAETQRITRELAEVARYESVYDPATRTHNHTAVPVYAGAARTQRLNRQSDIARHVLALSGAEGNARIARAADAEVAKRAAAHEDARIVRVAEVRAREMVADERIETLAATKAKALRSGFGV